MSLFSLFPQWMILLGAALLIGGLIGLEQESYNKEMHFGGIRTFPLISLLGFSSVYFFKSDILFCGVFIGFTAFILIGYTYEAFKLNRRGITREVAGIITFMLGAAVGKGYVVESVTISIIVTLLLSEKDLLHSFVAKHIGENDIIAVLKFLVVTVVLYPLLPDKSYTFLKINPKSIWLMVILISSISFAAYFATKIFGSRKGIFMTSIFGGLVSSTAVTLAFARRSRETPQLARDLSYGILLASTIMFMRQLFILLVIYPKIGVYFSPFAVIMFLIGIMLVLTSKVKKREAVEVSFTNPYELSYALMFGLFYTFILILSKLAHHYLGSLGLYFVGFISGIADVDPATVSMAQLSKQQLVTLRVALIAVMISSITNTVVKGIFATMFGDRKLYTMLWRAFAILTIFGIVFIIALNKFLLYN